MRFIFAFVPLHLCVLFSHLCILFARLSFAFILIFLCDWFFTVIKLLAYVSCTFMYFVHSCIRFSTNMRFIFAFVYLHLCVLLSHLCIFFARLAFTPILIFSCDWFFTVIKFYLYIHAFCAFYSHLRFMYVIGFSHFLHFLLLHLCNFYLHTCDLLLFATGFSLLAVADGHPVMPFFLRRCLEAPCYPSRGIAAIRVELHSCRTLPAQMLGRRLCLCHQAVRPNAWTLGVPMPSGCASARFDVGPALMSVGFGRAYADRLFARMRRRDGFDSSNTSRSIARMWRRTALADLTPPG